MAQPAYRWALPEFLKQGELEGRELEQRLELVEFCKTLCRSILQSSYYSADHPQARRVVGEPYSLLKTLGSSWPEFTFIVTSWREDECLALDGVFTEAIPLDELILGTAGEHFSVKMANFCKRNKLISFSLKNTIREDEFHRFVSVFVEYHVNTDAAEILDTTSTGPSAPVRFTERLLAERIINVTVVLEEDLVSDQRRLPWRVKVALARLKKDLKLVPLYKDASKEELRRVKVRLLQDILRPLRSAVFMKQLFLNLDLVAEEIAELQGVDLEFDMVSALPIDRVILLGEALITELERLDHTSLGEEDGVFRDDLEDAINGLLKMIGTRLPKDEVDDRTLSLYRGLCDASAIDISDVPRVIQEQVRMDRWTKTFLQNPDEFLALFNEIESPEGYVQQLPHVVVIVPNLVKIKQYDHASKIIDMLHIHRTTPGKFDGREALVAKALEKLDNEEVMRLLTHAMTHEAPEIRGQIRQLFVAMGTGSIPHLIRMLDESERADVAEEIALALTDLGRQAVGPLTALLQERKLLRDTARYVLKVLGELQPTPEVAKILAEYTKHPKPRVRDAAIESLFKLYGKQAEPVFMRVLEDRDVNVVCRVIRFLDRIESRNPKFIDRLVATIQPLSEEEEFTPDVERVQLAALDCLKHIGPFTTQQGDSIEQVLIETLDKSNSGKMMARLRRGRAQETDNVRIAICETLVLVGGEQSLKRLGDTSHEVSPNVIERMNRFCFELKTRLEDETSAPT